MILSPAQRRSHIEDALEALAEAGKNAAIVATGQDEVATAICHIGYAVRDLKLAMDRIPQSRMDAVAEVMPP